MRSGTKDEPSVSPFDLVPPFEQTRLVCMIAADGDVAAFRVLYEETDYAEVWEIIGLQKAANFTPAPKPADYK